MGSTYPEDLPSPDDNEDKLYRWIFEYVHANYAEHFSKLYDGAPDGTISTAIAITYDAVRKLLLSTESVESDNVIYDDDDEDDDDDNDGDVWA